MSALKWDTDSVQARILNRVRGKASWAQILTDSTSPRLIEAVGDEFAELANQDEFLTRESAWSVAKNRTSLVAGSKGYNYIAHRKIGATGLVAVSSNKIFFSSPWSTWATYLLNGTVYYNGLVYKSIQAANAGNEPDISPLCWTPISTVYAGIIGIPQWTSFTSTLGLKYVSTAAANLTSNDNAIEVPVVQGVYKSVTFIAKGVPNEELFLSDPNIDNVFYYVYRNGTLQTENDLILNAGPTDQVFETEDARDFSGVYFTFGDNVNGAKLNPNDQITIQYVQTGGSAGDITAQNTITTINSTLYDTNGIVVPCYCNNLSSIAGGQDYEGIESIRQNAPIALQAGNSLTYEEGLRVYLLDNFSFVGQCIVWGSYEQNTDAGLDPSTFIPSEQNLTYIAAITPGPSPLDILVNQDGTPNISYKNQIISATVLRKGFTDLFQFQKVTFIYLRAISTLTVLDSAASLQAVVSSTETALFNGYKDADNVTRIGFGIQNLKFKQAIYSSQLNTFISGIPNVDHHTSYLEVMKYAKFGVATVLPYTVSASLELFPVRQGSITVSVIDLNGIETIIATDNLAGNFVPAAGFTLGTSGMTYATGGLSLVVNAGPAGFWNPSAQYTVKVYYRPLADDVIPSKRLQILYLQDTDVNAEYS